MTLLMVPQIKFFMFQYEYFHLPKTKDFLRLFAKAMHPKITGGTFAAKSSNTGHRISVRMHKPDILNRKRRRKQL